MFSSAGCLEEFQFFWRFCASSCAEEWRLNSCWEHQCENECIWSFIRWKCYSCLHELFFHLTFIFIVSKEHHEHSEKFFFYVPQKKTVTGLDQHVWMMTEYSHVCSDHDNCSRDSSGLQAADGCEKETRVFAGFLQQATALLGRAGAEVWEYIKSILNTSAIRTETETLRHDSTQSHI